MKTAVNQQPAVVIDDQEKPGPHPVLLAQHVRDSRRRAGRQLQAQRGRLLQQLGTVTDQPAVRARLGSQRLETAGPPGPHPTVDRVAGIAALAAIRMGMSARRDRPHHNPPLGRTQLRVDRFGDDRPTVQSDRFNQLIVHAGDLLSGGAFKAQEESNAACRARSTAYPWWRPAARRRSPATPPTSSYPQPARPANERLTTPSRSPPAPLGPPLREGGGQHRRSRPPRRRTRPPASPPAAGTDAATPAPSCTPPSAGRPPRPAN